VTKPNPKNCKNCSSKCAYDCAQFQYTIPHRTVLIISPLTSRQTSQLRCCLSEERGCQWPVFWCWQLHACWGNGSSKVSDPSHADKASGYSTSYCHGWWNGLLPKFLQCHENTAYHTGHRHIWGMKFLKTKLIKTFLRSSMGQKRLNNLAILSMGHRNALADRWHWCTKSVNKPCLQWWCHWL